MEIALIITSALAIVFFFALLRSISNSKAAVEAASSREKELVASRDRFAIEAEQASEELAERNDALERLEVDTTSLRERSTKLEAEVDQTNNDVHLLRSELDSAKVALETAEQRAEAATTKLADVEARNAALVDDRDRLVAENDDLSKQIRVRPTPAGVVLNEAVNSGMLDPGTLWNLEMARAERRWRNSVSTNPESDPSPFNGPEAAGLDPVRLAVEIEAAALREEVGAFITIDWQAGPIEDPARRILVLRVAQEILSAAAREPEASRLIVSGDNDVNLQLSAAEEGDEVANLILPAIESDLIEFATDRLDITVRAV